MVSISVLRLGHRIVRDKRVSTHVALVARAFGYLVVFGNSVANRAVNTIRETIVFKPLKAIIIIRKLFFKVRLRIFGYLSCTHFSHLSNTSIAQNIRGVKGYLPKKIPIKVS